MTSCSGHKTSLCAPTFLPKEELDTGLDEPSILQLVFHLTCSFHPPWMRNRYSSLRYCRARASGLIVSRIIYPDTMGIHQLGKLMLLCPPHPTGSSLLPTISIAFGVSSITIRCLCFHRCDYGKDLHLFGSSTMRYGRVFSHSVVYGNGYHSR